MENHSSFRLPCLAWHFSCAVGKPHGKGRYRRGEPLGREPRAAGVGPIPRRQRADVKPQASELPSALFAPYSSGVHSMLFAREAV